MEYGLINIINFFIVFFLLAPNIIFMKAIRFKEEKCKSKIILLTEQITRYACMILMVIPFVTKQFAFVSVNMFIVFIFGVPACLILYYIFWILYVKDMTYFKATFLAVLPTAIFLVTGISLMHIPLIVCALIFGASHIYVTRCNHR